MPHSNRQIVLDYFFFSRPVLMPPVWSIALLGTVHQGRQFPFATGSWALFMIQLFCLSGAIYTLNQLCDIESDRLNRKLLFLPDGIITPKSALWYSLGLHGCALAMAIPLGVRYLALTVLGLGLGVLYSLGHNPLKNRPVLGLIANMVGHGTIVYLLGSLFAGGGLLESLILAIPYTLAVGAVYLATTVPDREGDSIVGKRTIAVWVGDKPAMALATLLALIALLASMWLRDWYLTIPAIAVMPLFVAGIWRGRDLASRAAIGAVGFLSLAAVWAYPAYSVLLIIGFITTRLFFRWRFGMAYPTFISRSERGQGHVISQTHTDGVGS